MPAMTSTIADGSVVGWRFDNTYSRLPEVLSAPAQPVTVKDPQVSILNFHLATELGLNLHALSSDQAAQLFAGQVLPPGSQPIAQAYAGHQYGHFTMLGDGRAILLGEHRTPSGQLVDIQFKGAGPTKFSRRGDGRAALGPMLREYIVSEAMWALGIPTTRSLAVVTTGEPVYRTTVLRGAVLTRVAASHIRFGTFEYLAARQDTDNLRVLADYTIERHYPELLNSPQKYHELLRSVLDRQASLIAQWQLVGFIHGVMNTDNMSVSGETIDYGPCAFMNVYRPETVFSSIDHSGRYSYRNQPAIAQWNLARFAETLLPLFDADQDKAVEIAVGILREFPTRYEKYWLTGTRRKLGLQTDLEGDQELIKSLLDWMQSNSADFTNTFRDLSEGPMATQHNQNAAFQTWHTSWQQRLSQESSSPAEAGARMQAVNPAIIPRNHQVEAALSAAEEHNDLSKLQRLLEVLSNPFETNTDSTDYRELSPDDDQYQTFCGT